jgi:flavin reductase (DIM6/NTAB) family NADH-FMN oxidoreductase RutF|tara:strand:- start:833 stop:1603 length:771 start_codon:yes stop_codon:yes gene_type:complete
MILCYKKNYRKIILCTNCLISKNKEINKRKWEDVIEVVNLLVGGIKNMICFDKESINKLDHLYRINLINSCTGFKSANLLGTIDIKGNKNLAIFSSITHLGSDPCLICFIVRPKSEFRNTYDNIIETGFFTVNHVNKNDVGDAHHTSAKYPKNVSEFDKTNLEEEFIGDFIAPYVKSSKIKLGCKYVNEYNIKENGTILVIASIEELYIDENILEDDGWLKLENAGTVAINGLDGYVETQLLNRFDYARPKKEEGG